MPGFRYLDVTAEVGIEATGHTLAEAFANIALGMFNLIADLESVEEREALEVEVSAPDREALLVEWLNELLFLFEARRFLPRRFQVLELGETSLRARIYGERLDPHRHRLKTEVKSATYNMLKVQEGPPAVAQVVLDI